MPGPALERRIDVRRVDQRVKPGIHLPGRGAADLLGARGRQAAELPAGQAQERFGPALGDARGPSPFRPDPRGGSHDLLHFLRVRPRTPQRGFDALRRQAGLLDGAGRACSRPNPVSATPATSRSASASLTLSRNARAGAGSAARASALRDSPRGSVRPRS